MAILGGAVLRAGQRIIGWGPVQRIVAGLRWLAAKIAWLGENAQFVAFFAHFGVAHLLVEKLAQWWYILPDETAAVITLYAAVKEYWFDARYEKNPPQTFWMNTQDFIGYAAGAWLTVWWLR